MTQSLNRLRRFPPHGPFARSRKHDYPDILMICFPMFLINFLRYFGQGRRILPPAPSRFPPLLFMFFWRRDPQCFKPNVIKYYHRINKSTLKNRFFSERLRLVHTCDANANASTRKFTRPTQTQAQCNTQAQSSILRCIGVVVLSLSWSSSNKT